AMARPSQLEGRVLSILNDAVRRDAIPRSRRLLANALLGVLLLPAAAMRPWRSALESHSSEGNLALHKAPFRYTSKQIQLRTLPVVTDTLAWRRHPDAG